jgi:cell wall-associated NlpC family hydrolase
MDCSGLVHLTLRTYGVTVPRDAADQYEALAAVDIADVRAGDVYFFAPPDTPPTHVGWVSQPGRLLHASEGRDIEDVPMTTERTSTLMAAARPVG